jgi:hypothetical protein
MNQRLKTKVLKKIEAKSSVKRQKLSCFGVVARIDDLKLGGRNRYQVEINACIFPNELQNKLTTDGRISNTLIYDDTDKRIVEAMGKELLCEECGKECAVAREFGVSIYI